jgi:hypothetical protein
MTMRVLSMDDGATPAGGFEAFFETEWPAVRRVTVASGERRGS